MNIRDYCVASHADMFGIRFFLWMTKSYFSARDVKIIRPTDNAGKNLEETLTEINERKPYMKTCFLFYSGHCNENGFRMGQRSTLSVDYMSSRLTKFIQRSSIEKIMIAFDCCYAPSMIRNLAGIKNKEQHMPVCFQINASRPSTISFLPRNGNNSYFCKYFKQALTKYVDTGTQCSTDCAACVNAPIFETTDNIKLYEVFSYVDKHLRLIYIDKGMIAGDEPLWKPTLCMLDSDRDESNIAYRYLKNVKAHFFMSCPSSNTTVQVTENIDVDFQKLNTSLRKKFVGKNFSNAIAVRSETFIMVWVNMGNDLLASKHQSV